MRTVVFQTILLSFLCVSVVHAGKCHVVPGGTGDAPTIQAGIDLVAEGDTVLLADGVFQGSGNRDVEFGGKAITVRSESGNAKTCIIDCQDSGRGFWFRHGEAADSRLEFVSIINGTAVLGGAISCEMGSSPVIEGCILSGNTSWYGGGIGCSFYSSPTISGCTITGNESSWMGGAGIHCDTNCSPTVVNCMISDNNSMLAAGIASWYSSHPLIVNSTLCRNSAIAGGAIHVLNSTATVRECVIAFNTDGMAMFCDFGSDVRITRSIIYANPMGDSLCGAHSDNFFTDPLFCNMGIGDLRVCSDSPCLPENNPWATLIGAYSEGCGECRSGADLASWGAIKQRYR